MASHFGQWYLYYQTAEGEKREVLQATSEGEAESAGAHRWAQLFGDRRRASGVFFPHSAGVRYDKRLSDPSEEADD